MENKYSPWSTEPDAPGVLIPGTPPSSLHGAHTASTAQTLRLAADSAEHDFTHTFREALQRQMAAALEVAELDAQQRALWDSVQQRWRAAAGRDARALRAALHPRYAGWIVDDEAPHDREATIARALEGPLLLHHDLVPKRIEIHGGKLAVVHYAYVAAVADEEGRRHVEGRRTEVYAAEGETWLLISASGGPL